MITRISVAAVGLIVAATALLGGATADHDDDWDDLFDNDFDDAFDDFDVFDSDFDDDLFDDDGCRVTAVVDVDSRGSVETDIRSNVDLDEDDILLGIALDRNIGGDIDLEDLVDRDFDISREIEIERDVDVDRDDVLAALAFGAGGLSDRMLLACAADVDSSIATDISRSQDIDLDEDDILLAIALDNNIGGIDFEDIVDGSRSSSRSFDIDRDVDFDRDDVLSLLALG